MELYKQTAEVFVKYLIQHGYPEDRIVFEWGTKTCAVDIVVVADDLKTPIAAFEIKGAKTPQTINNGVEQMKRAAQLLSLSVPMSLVFGVKNQPYFQIIDISDVVYRNEEISVEDILATEELQAPLSYKVINSSALGKNVLQKAEEKKERMDRLSKACWHIIPVFAVIVIVFDALQIYLLTTERLIVMGALLVVVLLPFYSEVSFKDFSVKRSKENK